MIDEDSIAARFAALDPQLDERSRRLFAASEVRAAGHGGLEAVSRITGMARSTIGRGLKDLDGAPLPIGRVRRQGSGRHDLTVDDPTLLEDLRRLVEPSTLGDPMRPLIWISKSLRKLAAGLASLGHSACPNTVRKLLGRLGYSGRVTARASKAVSMRIGMLSSSASTPGFAPVRPMPNR